MQLSAGVDLAAEPKGTAVAVLEWTGRVARLIDLRCPADDAAIVDAVRDAAVTGVDCPLGWPDPFIEFVARHRNGAIGGGDGTGPGWRRPLTNRTTDLACVEHTRRHAGRAVRPLSVSADLLGHTAMRAAVLLARFEAAGIDVDRSGVVGRVAEVYPAACLALWDVGPRAYKGRNRHRLTDAVDALLRTTDPWLQLGGFEQRCRTVDHCFDAVVAALSARAVQLGHASAPAAREAGLARREGWIRLPTCTLAELGPAPGS